MVTISSKPFLKHTVPTYITCSGRPDSIRLQRSSITSGDGRNDFRLAQVGIRRTFFGSMPSVINESREKDESTSILSSSSKSLACVLICDEHRAIMLSLVLPSKACRISSDTPLHG